MSSFGCELQLAYKIFDVSARTFSSSSSNQKQKHDRFRLYISNYVLIDTEFLFLT